MEVEVLRGEGDVRTGGGLEPAGVFFLAELTLSEAMAAASAFDRDGVDDARADGRAGTDRAEGVELREGMGDIT